jgi:hypothetical protein
MPFLLMERNDAVLRFQSIVQNDSLDIIQKQELYIMKGVELKINCLHSLSEERSSKTNCSEIFWQWNERRFENHNKSISQCLSILHIENVWWEGKQTFFCIYKEYTDNRELEVVENKSLVIIAGDKPKQVPQPSIQWIEDEVEITWIPNRDNYSVTEIKYTVEYSENGQKTILPSICGIFPLNNCSNRIEYYCRASFPARLLTSYSVKLVAENKFGRVAGNHMKVNIPLSQQRMMLKPVKDLTVFSRKFGVEMKWVDAPYYEERKKVWYKCQGISNTHTDYTYSDTFVISKDKLPVFTHCRFCISRQRYNAGKYSCDQCKVLRTAEDIPNGIPKLKSCQHNSTCPSVRFGGFKNVTISWLLPNKQSWNGLISRQLIFYFDENERVLQNITIRDSNVTEWTLNKLKISRRYRVFMVICTNAGCGNKSNMIYIPRFSESSVSFELQFFSDKANTGLVVGLTLGLLGLSFMFIFVFLYIKRHAVQMLPAIQEPPVTVEQESNQSPVQEAEYDLLEWRSDA